MNLISNHKIELFVESERVDIGDDGLDIKFNNTIQDPTKLTATTTTYSYSFKLPLTKKNARLLGNINVPSKRNKFNKRYNAILYADGIELFSGSLKVTDVEEGNAKCNLYISKLNTLDNIFGDTKMNEIDWKVDFDGVSTINAVNADMSTKYFFPFVAYNLFNKLPSETSESGYEGYSDKKTIDNTCRFYFNSFVPSMNLVETLKKCYALKGIELKGDVVNNDILNEIYLSNYIADSDDPMYNYGNPLIGTANFKVHFQNYQGNVNNSPTFLTNNMFIYDFPTDDDDKLWFAKVNDDDAYDSATVYAIMDKEAMGAGWDTTNTISASTNNGNMLVNGGVQIPADGYYQIKCNFEMGVPFVYNYLDSANKGTKDDSQSSHYINLKGTNHLPVEFQLLKYNTTDSDMDSLNHNIMYYGHFPNESRKIAVSGDTYDFYRYCSATSNTATDIANGMHTIAVDAYNNENYVCGAAIDNWGARYGYRKNGKSWNKETDVDTVALYDAPTYVKIFYKGKNEDEATIVDYKYNGYNQNELEGYEPTYGTASTPGIGAGAATAVAHNDGRPKVLSGTTAEGKSTTRRISGETCMILKLNKGEMLVPYLQARHYCAPNDLNTNKYYPIDIDLEMKVSALGKSDTDSSKLYYNMPSNFGDKLQLGNFFSSEQKISEFISNIQKAFNLDFSRNGNTVTMNLNKPYSIEKNTPISLDSRIGTNFDASFHNIAIDFPSKISVKYNIDTEEEGFYRSVPDSKINGDDWLDWGKYGYDEIEITDADDASELSQTLAFSYCWYNKFRLKQYYYSEELCTRAVTNAIDIEVNIQVPIIGKSEWWIEGYKYAEMAKKDGRSMKQRFWFRGKPAYTKDYTNEPNGWVQSEILRLPVGTGGVWKCHATYPYYQITLPEKSKEINGEVIWLDYENKKNSLLRKFFNTSFSSSDDSVQLNTYITPFEYKEILKGRCVQWNNDIYTVLKVQNYNPEDGSCKLTIMTI